MGFFDWFRRKTRTTVLPDTIWLTDQARLDGVRRAALERLGQDALVLVVAHFSSTLAELRQAFEAAGQADSRLVLLPAEALAGLPSVGTDPGRSLPISLIVAERHPLRSKDQALAEFAESLPPPCRLGFHVSLQDPMMRLFAGVWVGDMLRRMGMKEDQAIESRMVSRRVARAQRKIAAKASDDRPAAAAAEWLRLNCPDLTLPPF
jgi:hypothetical protein